MVAITGNIVLPVDIAWKDSKSIAALGIMIIITTGKTALHVELQ